MSRAFLTEKQIPRNFWYWAVVHAARMMNAIPGKYKGKLVSPFMLVHGKRPDPRTWTPIFSVCYFWCKKQGKTKHSTNQAQSLDGVVIGRCQHLNALLVYNPWSKERYEPDTYRIDPHRLPCSVYKDLVYNGSLFCSLLRDENPPMEEAYPPGTRVENIDKSTHIYKYGTVKDIPLAPASFGDKSSNVCYTIRFDDTTIMSVPLSDMADFVPKPPQGLATDEPAEDALLPPFLKESSKVTYDYEGQYVKGYIKKVNGVYRFSQKSHPDKKTENFGVNLPDLP